VIQTNLTDYFLVAREVTPRMLALAAAASSAPVSH
jgi:hypothetical protein